MGIITLITGGARSGKSTRALQLCEPYSEKVFVATAQALDDEMAARISKHKIERGGDWSTIEEPIRLAEALVKADKTGDVILVDCLTVWVANLMHHLNDEKLITAQTETFLKTVAAADSDLVLVTNEVGMGIVPADPETRLYRDLLGGLNRKAATMAHKVELTVAGIPVIVKQSE